jgi:arylsulfatase A-like enzyme
MTKPLRDILAMAVLSITLANCHSDHKPAENSLRFVHLYKPENLLAKVPLQTPNPLEWKFDRLEKDFGKTGGWEAFNDIADLRIENGLLKGRSTNDTPIIHLERTSGLQENDIFNSLEVRIRISQGSKIAFSLSGTEKLDVKETLQYKKDFAWSSKNVASGEHLQTCILTSPFTQTTRSTRHIFIQPTDVAGATFEIESIRLIMRKDYLASLPTGVTWQALSGIFQESVVMRAPEKLQFTVSLPQNPALELNLGTIEDSPVTFSLSIQQKGWNREQNVLNRTITTPQRWDRNLIDLSRFAGQTAVIRFSLSAEKSGTIGIWGNPVIRNLQNEAAQIEKPQRVILIWTDTLRKDHLTTYGYSRQTSPNIDALAKQGVKFADAIAQATWTKVATPAMMTSLYPTTNTVRNFYDRLPSSATTMAEVFYNAGYATINYCGNLFTGKFTNLHQGFEEVNEDVSLSDPTSSKNSRESVDKFLPWLESHKSIPFFAFLHLYDPHDPYKPKAPYDTFWADPTRDKQQEVELKKIVDAIDDPLMRLFKMPSKDEFQKAGIDPKPFIQYNVDLYDGSIRGMDTEIGRLIEKLKELDLDKKTMIVIAGDHGEEFLDHGKTFHGQSLYGELTDVTLIFWAPQFLPKNKVVPETVEMVDLMPTILELCNLRGPKEMQGESLVPLLKRNADAHSAEASEWHERPAISERADTGEETNAPPPFNYEAYSIISGPWKLIHHVKRKEGQAEFELFDRRNDPYDHHDVAANYPEMVQKLSREINLWKQHAEAVKLKSDSETTQNMTTEEIERLRALGYIQ